MKSDQLTTEHLTEPISWFARELSRLESPADTQYHKVSPLELRQARASIRKLLIKILDDGAAIQEVAARSYVHDNGFQKLVLMQSSNQISEIRLHLWNSLETFTQGAPNAHDHSAAFSSLILRGELNEDVYSEVGRPTEVSDDWFKYDCGSRGENDVYEMSCVGMAHLAVQRSSPIREGFIHSLGHLAIHKNTAAVLPTLSVFAQGPRMRRGVLAFSKCQIGGSPQVASPPLTTQALDSTIQTCISILS